MLRAWQLAILRFALTLDNSDRLAVLSIAREIDRLGEHGNSEGTFRFFRSASAELCAAISGQNEASDHVLRRYLARIDDARLKRAFAAAVAIDQPEAASVRKRAKRDAGLWRGLTPGRGVRA